MTLSDLFFNSIAPFEFFLNVIGVTVRPGTVCWIKRWISHLWSAFWVILSFQNSCETFILYLFPRTVKTKTNGQQIFSITDSLNYFFNAIAPLLFFFPVHITLVATIKRTIQLLLKSLEETCFQLLDVTEKLLFGRRYLTAVVVWITFTVRYLY